MREIRGSVDIEAPLARVWQAVTDFKSYPSWNPWLPRMDGDPTVGCRVGVTARAPGRKDTNFISEVLEVHPDQEILMRGMVLKGLLADDHLFRFERIGENRTRFFQSVEFKGMMSPLIGGIVRDQQKGLDLMNEALKRQCEGAGIR